MSALNADAKAELRYAGISQVGWARLQGYSDGRWSGDACGCPDDRCIGYHHDAGEDCGCLRVLLTDELRRRIAPPGATEFRAGTPNLSPSCGHTAGLHTDRCFETPAERS